MRSFEGDRHFHTMPFGAELRADGKVRFRLWAPAQKRISLVLGGKGNTRPMQPLDNGWHELITDGASAGTLYRFELEDGLLVPDPASRYQPNDVHGPSQVMDPCAFRWSDLAWRGRPWHETAIYELHVGAFTSEGSFRAVIGKLDHLVELGVSAIELMPIADFPGRRNWGYDGVDLFAPDASYGHPDDLKALVDACHAKRLMIFLDVVYNHFGPDGNYLHAYASPFFTERHKTPWGAAVNYDGPESRNVRDFAIHNALYWLEEFRFDGLRLDAVHAIKDESATHVLQEFAQEIRGRFEGERDVHLILENEENGARWLERGLKDRPRFYAAQWNDDLHHVLHTAATGEDAGYYAEYRGDTEKLARALAEGFVFQGEMMYYRRRRRGEVSRHLPPTAFVSFIQNHDQIGNRAFGDRISASTPTEALRAVAAIYLLAPQIPMLFMGEEWAAAQPFPFFCDFAAELGDAVRKGRREEFARFPEFRDPGARARIPDPTAEKTFRSAKLVWDDLAREPHRGWLAWYRRILSVRRSEIVPRLPGLRDCGRYELIGEDAVHVRWPLADGGELDLLANLSRAARHAPAIAGRTFWREGNMDAGKLMPRSVIWSIDEADRRR
jgi:malto-oligosyltrehalose trehalohydrolase